MERTVVPECADVGEGVEHVQHGNALRQLVETADVTADVLQQLTQNSGERDHRVISNSSGNYSGVLVY